MRARIIVVDDESDFLDSVRRGLITTGFKNVHTESDPTRAAEIIESGKHFDIALIDITMPGLSGIELMQTVKKVQPRIEVHHDHGPRRSTHGRGLLEKGRL